MTLDGHTVFADIDDLVKIERRAFGFRGEARVSRGLNFVSHTPATVGDSLSRNRGNSHHGEEPEFLLVHINAGLWKSKQRRKEVEK
jgi:hypothetical protein